MRLGTDSSNEFLQSLNKKNQEIQKLYVDHIKNLTKTVQIKVMLGDSTITDQSTFDPQEIKNFYEKIIKNLRDWSIQNITITNNEDIRRIFTKFEIREGNYLLSGHLSQQFHVLLYYPFFIPHIKEQLCRSLAFLPAIDCEFVYIHLYEFPGVFPAKAPAELQCIIEGFVLMLQ